MAMEKPKCLCGESMVFGMDNKPKEIWECRECGRLVLRHKESGWLTWYVPEAKLKGDWKLEQKGG